MTQGTAERAATSQTTTSPTTPRNLATGLPADYAGLREHFAPLLGEIAAGSLERDLERRLPFAEVRRLDEAGFGTLRVPREHGGPGVGVEDFTRLLIDLAEADSNIAHLYRSHAGFVESLRFLPARVQDAWYPRVLARATGGNAPTAEGGNALGTPNTALRRTEARRVLNGRK